MNLNSFVALFDQAGSVRFTWLILHFLWQGLAIGMAVFIINLLARGQSPRFRYAVAVTGMLAMVACVVGTWIITQPVPVSMESDLAWADLPLQGRPETGPTVTGTELDSSQLEQTAQSESSIEAWAPIAMAVYTVGVTLMLLRLGCSVIGISRLRNTSQVTTAGLTIRLKELSREIGLRAEPTLKTCERVLVPIVVGIVRPTILLPSLVMSGMTERELDAILVHELAHLRRGDMVVNYLQRIVEAVLFFHPAVWYVSRVVTIEREICCDDVVLDRCSRKDYASALIRLAEACTGYAGDPEMTTALAATGAGPSQLKRRVMRILGVKSAPRSNKPGFGVLIACMIVITTTTYYLQAQTEDDLDSTSDVQATQQDEALAPARDEAEGGPHVSEPLLVYLAKDSVVISAPKDEISRLTRVLNKLVNHPNTKVTSIGIDLKDDRQVMTLKGNNLDFNVIKSAIRKQDAPIVRKIVEELKRTYRTAGEHRTTDPSTSPFLGPVNLEAVGDSIILRGQKHDVDRLTKIIEGIEHLPSAHEAPNQATDHLKADRGIDQDSEGTGGEEAAEETTSNTTSLTTQQAVAVLQQLLRLQAQENEAATYYLPAHPNRKMMRASIESLERQLGLQPKSTHDLGPVRIEIIDGTDTFVVRGRKGDVDRVMKLIKGMQAELEEKKEITGEQPPSAEQTSEAHGTLRSFSIQLSDLAKPQDVMLALASFIEGKGIAEDSTTYHVDTGKTGNALLVRTSEAHIEDIMAFLRKRDWAASSREIAPTDEPVYSIYHLRNAVADEVRGVLDEVFRDLFNGKAKPAFSTDPHQNAILVAAPGPLQKQIAAMVRRLDEAPVDDQDTEFVAYQLKYASAESVLKSLNSLFGGAKPNIATDLRTNRILASATREEHKRIAALLKQFEQGAAKPSEHALAAEGRKLYKQHCVHCHGAAGKGDGPTARFLDPHPRDFVSGEFKHVRRGTTHTLGDVTRIVKAGVKGTAMPSFSLLGDQQRRSLAAYVIHLADERKPLWRVTVSPDSPPGYLRFPIDVERGMMLDASDLNPSKR